VDIPFSGTDLFLTLANGRLVINLLLADQNIQKIRSGDNTKDDFLVNNWQNSLFALNNIFLNFENVGRWWYRDHLRCHVFTHGHIVKLMI